MEDETRVCSTRSILFIKLSMGATACCSVTRKWVAQAWLWGYKPSNGTQRYQVIFWVYILAQGLLEIIWMKGYWGRSSNQAQLWLFYYILWCDVIYHTRAIITRGLYTFWSPKTFFQGAFFLKLLPYVWLVFKSGL